MDTSQLAHPKPEPVARTRNRRRRLEAAVIDEVREKVFARDRVCRAAHVPPGCDGRLTLAHLPPYRRGQTRGRKPEERHHPTFCVALCSRHHVMEETHKITAVALTKSLANGPIRWEVR